jgi:DNA polymerase-3 subunit epsilon
LNNYLLFIDTEATDLPKDWTLPFTAPDNWPHALQISWIVYDKHRVEVKREDHYISISDDVEISESALKVHGITPAYLQQHGEDINKVLQLFIDDLVFYNPLVIGHFVKMDYYVIGAELHRAGIKDVLEKVPVFCTMTTSGHIMQNTTSRQLRLDELYNTLFYKELIHPHNALYDALHAADCYFELSDRGEITQKMIDQQNQNSYKWRQPEVKQKGCLFPFIMFVLAGALICYFI